MRIEFFHEDQRSDKHEEVYSLFLQLCEHAWLWKQYVKNSK